MLDPIFDTDSEVSSVKGEQSESLDFGNDATIGGINPLSIDSSMDAFILRTLWQIVLFLTSSAENPEIFITSGHFNAGISSQRLAAFSYLASFLTDVVGISGVSRILSNSVAALFNKG